MTEQSVEIKTTLDKGVDVVSTKVGDYFIDIRCLVLIIMQKFRLKLDLLRKQVEPLKEGMRVYATQIA